MADNIKVLNGIQSHKRFSGGSDSKYKPQSCPPAMGCFLPKLPMVSIQASGGSGIRSVIYLDNILFLDQDKTKLMEHTQGTTLSLLEALGFLVNYPKSVLEPTCTQKLIFLSFIINSVKNELSLPQKKMDIIVKEAKAILKVQQISARSLAQLIGKMSTALLAIQPAPSTIRVYRILSM